MVEAKLRVEVTRISNVVNPIYGGTITKNVIEETFIHDYDKRDKSEIAPCGVMAIFSIDKSYESADGKKIDAKEIIDIKINKYYLEEVADNGYNAFFQHDGKVYELFIHFGGKHITYISLSEWLDKDEFEDGVDADNIYDKCVSCDILES